MMASNLISRLLPSNPTARSIYEDLRAYDEASAPSDIEERAGLALDEENLGFRDDELEDAEVFNGDDSRLTTDSTTFLAGEQRHRQVGADPDRKRRPQRSRSKWLAQSPRLLEEEGDNDVPESLLIEGNDNPGPGAGEHPQIRQPKPPTRLPPMPGASTRETRAHWEATQAQQRLHQDNDSRNPNNPQPCLQKGIFMGSQREKAMWRWINITNLDNFIKQVYDYYTGAGIWCILLDRALSLL